LLLGIFWHQNSLQLSCLSLGSFLAASGPHKIVQAAMASDTEVRELIERRKLYGKGIGYIDAHLLAQGPYLLGAEFSAADLMLIMLMRWSRKMPHPATEWPALMKLANLVRARASWKKLYELEGLTEW